MISANRLLLRQLSAAPTLRRVCRVRHISYSRTVHLRESTAAKLQGGDEDYPSTLVRITDDRIVHDTIPKNDVALQLEMDPFQSTFKKFNDVSPEEVTPQKVIRTGTIEWINFEKMYGVLVQDSQYHTIGPIKNDKVFFHFINIYPELRINEDIKLDPVIDVKRRFQFQARKHSTQENVLEGFNLRYEGGDDIPLIHWSGSIVLIKKAKATLGHDIYDILSKSSGKDTKQIARKVDDAIATCNKRVVWAKEQIINPTKAARERKARFGNEIYELLWNIARVDNIQLRTDEAYNRCLKDLSALGLTEFQS